MRWTRPATVARWLRHGGFKLAAAASIVVAAAAACSATAATSPVRPDSREIPVSRTCPAHKGWTAITLTDTLPRRTVTVAPGAHLVVTVPPWGWGTASDVHLVSAGILREQCTVLLADRGRRVVYVAASPGSTWLDATVRPAGNAMMPSWSARVTVRAARG